MNSAILFYNKFIHKTRNGILIWIQKRKHVKQRHQNKLLDDEKFDTNQFKTLPVEMLWALFESMDPSSLMRFRETSMEHKANVELFLQQTIIDNPEKLMEMVGKLPPKESAILLSYYATHTSSIPERSSELTKKSFSEMTAMEVFCYALIRGPHDKIEGFETRLDEVIKGNEFIFFNSDMQNSFNVMSCFLQYSAWSIKDSNENIDDKLKLEEQLHILLQSRSHTSFLNLSGLDLSCLRIELIDLPAHAFMRGPYLDMVDPAKLSLTNGNLSYCDLSNTNLFRASLVGLNLSNANLN